MSTPSPPSFSKYNLTLHKITGSTQISKKTTQILSQLANPVENAEKQIIIALTANARYANKVISIVEIAKREVAATSGKALFQYNAVTSEMVEIEREPQKGKDDGEGKEDAFESIEARFVTGEKKKRVVPVLTVYLSGVSVKELRVVYGEQR